MFNLSHKAKAHSVFVIITLFVFVQIVGVFGFARPAQAALPVSIFEDFARKTEQIMESIDEVLLAAAMGGIINGASYMMRKLAYDSAKWIASGGKGQGALAFQDGFGKYMENVAKDSLASAVDQFSKPFGLNFCNPSSLNVQVYIQIGIRKTYDTGQGPAPDCTWEQFSTQVERLTSGEAFTDFGEDVIAQNFNSALRVDQTDFGLALGLFGKTHDLLAEAKAAAEKSRLEGSGIKPLTNLISGAIRTPATVVKQEIPTAKDLSGKTSQQIAGIYGSASINAITTAGSVFVNTLLTSLLDNLLNDGLLPDPSGSRQAASEAVVNPTAQVLNFNSDVAKEAFNFLLTAVPHKDDGVYGLIDRFTSCPEEPQNIHLDNCVIGRGFADAIERARIDKPLTIREAMKGTNPPLPGNLPLIPPTNEEVTRDRFCFKQGYCYANLQKLRKARVLPLGFEIAALKADPDKSQDWTLEKVVNGFDDCSPDGTADKAHPYCHLIDPNWIIRLPEPRCEARVFGPNLLSNSLPQRLEECADLSTCIAEDESGNCLGQWGYCLREKNTWRFDTASCPAQFATCVSYVNNGTGQVQSLLSRTVDYGLCSVESVGCAAYSLNQDAAGEWQDSGSIDLAAKKIGNNQVVYLNETAISQSSVCNNEEDGCSAFYGQRFNAEAGSTEKTLLHLKKAPDALRCYDADTNTPEIDWPVTDADLEKMVDKPEACDSYAYACIETEVGCRAYAPQNGDPTVTGIVGENACDVSCVGYDTFRQEASEFEPAQFPLYFIPNAEPIQTCDYQFVGCSEFTNIDEAAAGGEGLRYYSDLKYCEQPTGLNEKTYYSWEGSESTGFELLKHEMRPITGQDMAQYYGLISLSAEELLEYRVGSPAYHDDSLGVLQQNYAVCNEATYTNLINNTGVNEADPDCRAFYDDEGNVYYRLLEETITVSESCAPLRITDSYFEPDTTLTSVALCEYKGGLWGDNPDDDIDGAVCQRCFNGGRYQDGACMYAAIEEEATSCEGFNGCREYTGNNGNNIETILTKDFEVSAAPDAFVQAKEGWSQGEVTLDAAQVGLHSLEVDGATSYTFQETDVKPTTGGWYVLSFWTRGLPQNLTVDFYQDENDVVGSFTNNPSVEGDLKVSVGQSWKALELGPVEFTGAEGFDTKLRFISDNPIAGSFFIDTIILKRVDVEDKIYRIKDSWKRLVQDTDGNSVISDVPFVCDVEPLDELPGSELGCKAYTDVDIDTEIYTTGFDKLCRPEAAGCEPLIDTHNTIDVPGDVNELNEQKMHVYNAWCTGAPTTECTIIDVAGTEHTCTVPLGETGCYIVGPVLADTEAEIQNTWITKSTIIFPADTPEDAPIYLTYSSESVCNSEFRGCRSVGREEQIVPGADTALYSFTEQHIKNDPALYESILCSANVLGCQEYKSDNGISYFKDPALTGNKMCIYVPSAQQGNKTVSGWFKKDIGTCSNDNNVLCKVDDDCKENEDDPATCENSLVPCYENYIELGGQHGIWSNESPDYDGFVGECQPQYNGCVQLLDPADKTATEPDGKPYHIILDDLVKSQASECSGQASLVEECVLFDRTDVPNKIYDSTATYNKSAQNGNAKVSPVIEGALDTNTLLKVRRDRTCSEWLACKDKTAVIDENNTTRYICSQFRACRGADGGNCTDWPVFTDTSDTQLTEDKYIGRDTTWFGEDYTGYSLFNKYQIHDLVTLNFEDEISSYLAYEANPWLLQDILLSEGQTATCDNGKPDWSACGYAGDGRCLSGRCIYPLDGSFANEVDTKEEVLNYLVDGTCKAYPEDSSPFPHSFAETINELQSPTDPADKRYHVEKKKSGYEGANICQDGNCSCEYTKVTYKGSAQADYWPQEEFNYPSGVCSGSVGEGVGGRPCKFDVDCRVAGEDGTIISAGICQRRESVVSHLGMRGFCLEYDVSRPLDSEQGIYPCLTWLPVDIGATAYDPYSGGPEAGYHPPKDARTVFKSQNGAETVYNYGQAYCTNATANVLGAYDDQFYDRIARVSTLTTGECDDTSEQNDFRCNRALNEIMFDGFGDYFYDDATHFHNKSGVYTTKISKLKDPFNTQWTQTVGIDDRIDYLGAQSVEVELSDLYPNVPVVSGVHPTTGKPLELFGVPFSILDWVGGDYQRRLYPFMQHWAWTGGMYKEGLSRIVTSSTWPIHMVTAEEAEQIANAACGSSTTSICIDAVSKTPGFKGSLAANANAKDVCEDEPFELPLQECKVVVKKSIDDEINRSVLNGKIASIMASNGEQTHSIFSAALPEISHPTAVVTALSGHYFRDYLFTTHWKATPKTFFGAQNDFNYELKPVPVQLAYDHTWSSTHKNYHPSFEPYRSDVVIYDTHLGKYHFGPILGFPQVSGDNTLSSAMPRVVTFNFDYFNLTAPEVREAPGGLKYDFWSQWDYEKRIYTVKIRPHNTNETKYRAFIMLNKHGDKNTQFVGMTDKKDIDTWYKGKVDRLVLSDDLLPWENHGTYFHSNNTTLEIGMDFDASGKKKNSYWFSTLSQASHIYEHHFDGSQNNWPWLAEVAELHPQCAEYAFVYDDQTLPHQQTDKAWTDRTWEYSDYGMPYIGRTYSMVPFGSVPHTHETFMLSSEAGMPYYLLRKKESFISEFTDGFAPHCRALPLEYSTTASHNQKLAGVEFKDQWPQQYCFPRYVGGNVLADTSGFAQQPGETVTNKGQRRLSRVFADAFSVGVYSDHTKIYQNIGGFDESGTVHTQLVEESNDPKLLPPQVYSLNPIRCFGTNTDCVAAEKNNITINQLNGTNFDYDGDGLPDEDLNGDGAGDPIVAKQYNAATLNFFAFADHNRMPIRRVMIDYGDGTVLNTDRFGKYVNRKPYCLTADDNPQPEIGECTPLLGKTTQLTCKSNTDCPAGTECSTQFDQAYSFGNSTRACSTLPFEFQHGYSCNEIDILIGGPYVVDFDELTQNEQNKLLELGFTKNLYPKVCKFVPKVQVLDNWGWCNGDCENGGCYNDGVVDFCGPDSVNGWTEYQGAIIVVPG